MSIFYKLHKGIHISPNMYSSNLLRQILNNNVKAVVEIKELLMKSTKICVSEKCILFLRISFELQF